MISIEAHRAAIGGFCRKAKYISLRNESKEWKDVVILIMLLTFLVLMLYALVITTMFLCYNYIKSILMVTMLYAHSYWILKTSSVILSNFMQKMAKRNELMRNPVPPNGVKVPALIPCNYLDTYVFDGRRKYLDTTFVLDDGSREA